MTWPVMPVVTAAGALTAVIFFLFVSRDEKWNQQLREAETLAGHVRAELTASAARMEGLLQSGAALDAVGDP